MNKKMFITVGGIMYHDKRKNQQYYTFDHYCNRETELLEVEVVKVCRVNVQILTPNGFGEPHVLSVPPFKFEEDNYGYLPVSTSQFVYESEEQFHLCTLIEAIQFAKMELHYMLHTLNANGPIRRAFGDEYASGELQSCIQDLDRNNADIRKAYNTYRNDRKNPS